LNGENGAIMQGQGTVPRTARTGNKGFKKERGRGKALCWSGQRDGKRKGEEEEFRPDQKKEESPRIANRKIDEEKKNKFWTGKGEKA